MKKGEKMSDEQKAKISKANTGRKLTPEHVEKLRKSHLGQIPTNIEQLRILNTGRPLTEDHKRKIGVSNLGKKRSEETRKKISQGKKGKMLGNTNGFKKGQTAWNKDKKGTFKHTQEYKDKKRDMFLGKNNPNYGKDMSGSNAPAWKEDRTKIIGRHERTFHDSEYKQWCKNVFKRDNRKCRTPNQECSGRIEAHHILRWKDYPEFRYEVSNGITLCHFHHPKTRKKEDEMVDTFQKLIAN